MLALNLPYPLIYLLLIVALGTFILTAVYVKQKKFYPAVLSDCVGLVCLLVISLAGRATSADLIETNHTRFLVTTIGSTLLMIVGMIFLIAILIKALNLQKEQS